MNFPAMEHRASVARDGIDAFFNPRSVAVIGASSKPGKLGHTVVRNIVAGGFAGRVFAVNPAGVEIDGAVAVARLSDIEEPVDLAFLAVPASLVEAAIDDCIGCGVAAVVIGASGFAELGTEEGRAREDRIARIAARSGLRMLGPNTNGLLSVPASLSCGYNASHAERFEPGNVSVLSHSGALFDGIAKRLQGFGAGISRFVAVGNETDVTLLELLEYLVEDRTTQVIGLVIEGLSDGPRLRRVAQRLAAAKKRVVALKIGRSDAGASATLAHSARMAGSSRAWDALLWACGFASVRTVEALAGSCAILSRWHGVHGDSRLLCVTSSGAGGALLADLAEERGIELAPRWDPPATATIARLPTAAAVRHPIDLGSLGDWGLLEPVLASLEDAGYRGPMAVYAHVAPMPGMAEVLAETLIARSRRVGQPVVVLAPGGLGDAVERRYVAAGVPVFHDAVTCVESLAVLGTSALEAWPDADVVDQPDEAIGSLIRQAGTGAIMTESVSADLLRLAGVPLVESAIAHDIEEAVDAATRIGYPVVLKALVPGVAHKHQAGLVAVGIADEAQLRHAFGLQADRADAFAAGTPTAWLIQPLIRGRFELIAGLTAEPGLGHFLVWGFGGIHAEVFDEVQLLSLPSSAATIARRFASTRCGVILEAFDPTLAATSAFVALLVALKRLAERHGDQLRAVDVNPVLVLDNRVLAVDALVMTA